MGNNCRSWRKCSCVSPTDVKIGWLKKVIDFRKNMGYYNIDYPALDQTTPHYEFNSYVECCESLNRPVRIGGFMRYQAYLKEIGVI